MAHVSKRRSVDKTNTTMIYTMQTPPWWLWLGIMIYMEIYTHKTCDWHKSEVFIKSFDTRRSEP